MLRVGVARENRAQKPGRAVPGSLSGIIARGAAKRCLCTQALQSEVLRMVRRGTGPASGDALARAVSLTGPLAAHDRPRPFPGSVRDRLAKLSSRQGDRLCTLWSRNMLSFRCGCQRRWCRRCRRNSCASDGVPLQWRASCPPRRSSVILPQAAILQHQNSVGVLACTGWR